MTPCDNADMTGESAMVNLLGSGPENSTDGMADDEASLLDIIRPGDIVAVIADDETEDYYLLKVSNNYQFTLIYSCEIYSQT